MPKRTCKHCKAEFEPYRASQRFCSGGQCKKDFEKSQRELAASLDKQRRGKTAAAIAMGKRRMAFLTPEQRKELSRKAHEAKRLKSTVPDHAIELAATLEGIAKGLRSGRLSPLDFDTHTESSSVFRISTTIHNREKKAAC